MGTISRRSLLDAGCDPELANRCAQQLEEGDADACLRLLRSHRCELVEAMHEAQRPIDVCDWIIWEVETQYA